MKTTGGHVFGWNTYCPCQSLAIRRTVLSAGVWSLGIVGVSNGTELDGQHLGNLGCKTDLGPGMNVYNFNVPVILQWPWQMAVSAAALNSDATMQLQWTGHWESEIM